MTYQEVLEQARTCMGKCHACPVCNGLACKNTVPGPGAKGLGTGAIRNYQKWQELCVNMDTICENGDVDTSYDFFGHKLAIPVMAGPVGAVTLHYSDKHDDLSYNNVLVEGCANAGIIAFTGDGTTPAVMEELEHTVIPGDILERIEAAGGHYEIEADIIYVDRFALIQGYYISFECEAGVEMTGNLLTVSADMPETWHGSLPAVNHAGIHSAEIFHHANGRDYEVPTVLTNCPFNILPAMGDVNLDGSVTIADALQVMRHAIEVLTLEGASLEAADVNGDGVIGLPDAILIARRAMGL